MSFLRIPNEILIRFRVQGLGLGGFGFRVWGLGVLGQIEVHWLPSHSPALGSLGDSIGSGKPTQSGAWWASKMGSPPTSDPRRPFEARGKS